MKATIKLAYESGPYIEHEILINHVSELENISSVVKRNMLDKVPTFICVIPYNEDPNSNVLASDLIISLKGLRSYATVVEVIESKKPI